MDGATKEEIQNLIKQVLTTFTTAYVKHYTLGLVKKAELEAMATPGPDWKLTPRPANSNTEDLKVGYLTKEGAIRKSWKKRWFVVRPDYVVEYFKDEKAAQGQKPKSKGKMFLAGYRVIEDIGASLLEQLTKLADMMKMDISELPKPKKYSDLTFEVHHERRRCFFIEAATPEEKKEWVAMFKNVCWYAYGFENRDPTHKAAFGLAIRDTRWHLGRWGYWSWGGSETQILSDLISDELDYAIMGRVYAKLQGPWIVRSKLRDQVLKVIDTMVSAAVNPAWAGMAKTVEELRPKMEPVIVKAVEPLGKKKAEIIEKMKEGCMSVINPILEQNVVPHLSKILEIIKSPVVGGFDTAIELWEKKIGEFAGKFDAKECDKNFRDLDWFGRSYWEARPATEKLDVMYEPLWALREVFNDIYPWSTIYNGQDQIRTTIDSAIYTFELELKKLVEENNATPVDTAKASVLEKFRADAKTSTTLFYLVIFKDIIMPVLNKLVIPAVKTILEPIDSMVPDELKQLIDIMDMFNRLLNGIVDESIKTVLN